MSSQLKKELREAGATDAEVSQLAALAAQLPHLKDFKHINDEEPAAKRQSRLLFNLLAGMLAGGAFGVLLILMSQPVLPTNWLYPVQKFSDNVAIAVRPQYRATVMMQRAQQVNALVASHASQQIILATLSDYTYQAKTYETMPHASYAAFAFCKTDLEQAEVSAPPQVREAIQNSLQSLDVT